MNDNYDTDNFNAEHLQSQVRTIHICGYRNEHNEGDDAGNPPTNHWTVFLELLNSTSIKLDMAPGYGPEGRIGKIQLASKAYVYTQNAIKTMSFQAKVDVTVESITQLINSKGRERYTFTEELEGCRFWIYMFIQDLEAAGIIDAGSGQSTWEAVLNYWRSPSGYEPRTLKQGTFYSA